MQLEQLKKNFERSKHELLLFQNLSIKRENSYQKMQELKGEVEYALTRLHAFNNRASSQARILEVAIKEKSEQIDKLKKVIRHLDQDIDALGDDKEAEFEANKKNLITKIHEIYPDSRRAYAQIERDKQEAIMLKNGLIEDKNKIEPLSDMLFDLLQIKKKKSILNFFFGKRGTITRAFFIAHDYAKKIHPEIHDHELKAYLQEFLSETDRAWSKAFYNEKIDRLVDHLNPLLARLEEKIQQQNTFLSSLDHSLDSWISQYT
jgi:IS1 family transposase